MTIQEDNLRELYVTYPAGVFQHDTIEISHSLFTQRFLFTREPLGLTGVTITNVGGGTEVVDFEGVNFELVLNQKKSDLDSNFSFTFADPTNQLDDELDLIPLDDTEKIVVVYRSYRSDDFSGEGELFRLEALNVSQEKGIFTVACGVPQLNWQETGIRYEYDVFPMLRAI